MIHQYSKFARKAKKRLDSSPVFLVMGCFALCIILLVIFWSFDIARCSTKYLYISSEIGLIFFSAILYLATFSRIRWNDPPEKSDGQPKPHWSQFAKSLGLGFGILVCTLLCIWFGMGIFGHYTFDVWLKKGIWSGYMLGAYIISIIIIAQNLKYVNAKALLVSATIMVYLLSTYEITLLDRGIGWTYNNTVIGYVFGIPLDNVLFVYTVTPVLVMIFYSVITRHLNDLVAFWLLNLIMIPVAVGFELLAVYPLDIWRVFTSQSVLPMGKTSIEEFLFYFIVLFSSVVLYAFFSRNLVKHNR
jgi:hypothetical protein